MIFLILLCFAVVFVDGTNRGMSRGIIFQIAAEEGFLGNYVVLFERSKCPLCGQTETIFQELGVSFKAINLDIDSRGPSMQAALEQITTMRDTLPFVVINGYYYGDAIETQYGLWNGDLYNVIISLGLSTRIGPHVNLAPALTVKKEMPLGFIDYNGPADMAMSILPQIICRVEIQVVEARGVSHSNFVYQEEYGRFVLTASSDPFVITTLEDQVFVTPTIPNTLNPVWNSSFLMYGKNIKAGVNEAVPLSTVIFRVYDNDTEDFNHLLGQVRVDLRSLSDGVWIDKWTAMYSADMSALVPGQLHIRIRMSYIESFLGFRSRLCRLIGLWLDDVDAATGQVRINITATFGTLGFQTDYSKITILNGADPHQMYSSISFQGSLKEVQRISSSIAYRCTANVNIDSVNAVISDLGNTGAGGEQFASQYFEVWLNPGLRNRFPSLLYGDPRGKSTMSCYTGVAVALPNLIPRDIDVGGGIMSVSISASSGNVMVDSSNAQTYISIAEARDIALSDYAGITTRTVACKGVNDGDPLVQYVITGPEINGDFVIEKTSLIGKDADSEVSLWLSSVNADRWIYDTLAAYESLLVDQYTTGPMWISYYVNATGPVDVLLLQDEDLESYLLSKSDVVRKQSAASCFGVTSAMVFPVRIDTPGRWTLVAHNPSSVNAVSVSLMVDWQVSVLSAADLDFIGGSTRYADTCKLCMALLSNGQGGLTRGNPSKVWFSGVSSAQQVSVMGRIDDIEAALRHVWYTPSVIGSSTITFVLNDLNNTGYGGSGSASVVFNMQASAPPVVANTPPTVFLPFGTASLIVYQGSPILLGNITVDDDNVGGVTLALSLSATAGGVLRYSDAASWAASIVHSGSRLEINNILNQLKFMCQNCVGTSVVTIGITDGGGATTTVHVSLNMFTSRNQVFHATPTAGNLSSNILAVVGRPVLLFPYINVTDSDAGASIITAQIYSSYIANNLLAAPRAAPAARFRIQCEDVSCNHNVAGATTAIANDKLVIQAPLASLVNALRLVTITALYAQKPFSVTLGLQDEDGNQSNVVMMVNATSDLSNVNHAPQFTVNFPSSASIIGISVPPESMSQQCSVRESGLSTVGVAPHKQIDTSVGVGLLLNPSVVVDGSWDQIALADTHYIAAAIPDPTHANITYTFDFAVEVTEIHFISTVYGVLEIEVLIGFDLDGMISLGRSAIPDSTVFTEGTSQTFLIPSNRTAAPFLRIIITKTASPERWSLYRAYPIFHIPTVALSNGIAVQPGLMSVIVGQEVTLQGITLQDVDIGDDTTTDPDLASPFLLSLSCLTGTLDIQRASLTLLSGTDRAGKSFVFTARFSAIASAVQSIQYSALSPPVLQGDVRDLFTLDSLGLDRIIISITDLGQGNATRAKNATAVIDVTLIPEPTNTAGERDSIIQPNIKCLPCYEEDPSDEDLCLHVTQYYIRPKDSGTSYRVSAMQKYSEVQRRQWIKEYYHDCDYESLYSNHYDPERMLYKQPNSVEIEI